MFTVCTLSFSVPPPHILLSRDRRIISLMSIRSTLCSLKITIHSTTHTILFIHSCASKALLCYKLETEFSAHRLHYYPSNPFSCWMQFPFLSTLTTCVNSFSTECLSFITFDIDTSRDLHPDSSNPKWDLVYASETFKILTTETH